MMNLKKKQEAVQTAKSNNTNSSLLKLSSKLSVLTLCSRCLGLIREMIKSAFLGTNPLADAFTVSFMIPNLLRRLFAENSITVAFIPVFKEYLEDSSCTGDEKDKKIKEFLSAVFTLVTFTSACTVVLGVIFTPLIIKVFFPHIEDYNSTVLLTRIMFPYLFLISAAAFFQGILNGVKIFSPAGFTPILFNAVIIGFTYFLSAPLDNPAIAMSLGVIAGGTVQAMFQLPFVLKTGFRFSLLPLNRAFSNTGTKKVLKLIAPTIIGMAAYQLNDLVSTSLATSAGRGVASSLQYSLRLQELILGVFAVSAGTVILPDLSSLAMKQKWSEFQDILLNAIKGIAFITIPASFFLFYSGEAVITIIYKNRLFDDQSVRLTLAAFYPHITGLFFIAVNRVIAPAFYAQNDPKSPTVAGIFSFAVNIIAAAVLVKPMKGSGIASALSLAGVANTVLLFIFLKRKNNINASELICSSLFFILKMSLFSAAAILPLYFAGSRIYGLFAGTGRFTSTAIPFFITFLIFSFTGLLLLYLTGDKTIFKILKKILRRY